PTAPRARAPRARGGCWRCLDPAQPAARRLQLDGRAQRRHLPRPVVRSLGARQSGGVSMRRLLLALPLLITACPGGQDGEATPKPTMRDAPFEIQTAPARLFLERGTDVEVRVKNGGDEPIAPGLIYYEGIEGDVTEEQAKAQVPIAPGQELTFGFYLIGH